jgi:hypothetical protein
MMGPLTIRTLGRLGLTPTEIALVAEAMAADFDDVTDDENDVTDDVTRVQHLAMQRKRQAKYRARKRDAATSPTTSPKPPSPPRKEGPQTPKETQPLLPETFPPNVPPSAGKSLAEWSREIWQASPQLARKRSSQAETTEALRAAVGRGADPARVLAGLSAAFSGEYGGEYAKGVHRLIQNDRWREWADAKAGAEPGLFRTLATVPPAELATRTNDYLKLLEERDARAEAAADSPPGPVGRNGAGHLSGVR